MPSSTPLQSAVECLSRRDFLAAAAASMATAATAQTRAKAKKPNVVYLFADQMRRHAMGCAGNAQVLTPHMDRMAADGLHLHNTIACSPVCTPYRAQLLTGRYGHATGVITNDVRLPDSEKLLPECLKENGYRTGYIGKWHLAGYRKDPVDALNRRGWDFWASRNCSHAHDKPVYWLNDATKPISTPGWEPEVQTDLACEFIKQNQEAPFALFVSYGPPHNPYRAPQKYIDRYKGKTLTHRPNVPKGSDKDLLHYYAMVSSLDDCVGRIRAQLEKAGLLENTIFCFTSDHGDMLGSQGHRLKQRPWEESINVPFLLQWPAKIAPKQQRDLLLASVDMMPTFLGLCGASHPPNVQGINQANALLGQSTKERDAVYITNVHLGGGPLSDWRGIRTKDWIFAEHYKGDWVMYDLKKDPYQLKNLIDDPAFAKQKAQLKARLATEQKHLGDKRTLVGKTPYPIVLPQ